MTIGGLAVYVALAIAVSIILFFLQRKIHKKATWWIALIGFFVKLLLAVLFAVLAIAITSPLGWTYSFLSVTLYIAFFGDAVADLVGLAYVLCRKKPMNVTFRGVLGILLAVIFLCYGIVNMQTVVSDEHTYTSSKLRHEYKIVFFADLHYGWVQTDETVKKTFAKIKAENPDILLLGGDITDEYTTKEQMQELYKTIGGLGIKTYFIYGNHDRQPKADAWARGRQYTDEELVEVIEKNGITILRDEYEYYADDLIIMGREDESTGDDRAKVEDLPARPNDVFVLNVDHSPYQKDDIVKTRADLQLSGHTHDGQYFPLGVVYALFVQTVCGEFKVGQTDLYVSPGIAGWHDPVRTEQQCKYEVIYLRPKK